MIHATDPRTAQANPAAFAWGDPFTPARPPGTERIAGGAIITAFGVPGRARTGFQAVF